MRLLLLAVALVFTALIAGLTVRDMTTYGVTWIDVLALIVVVLFATGIVGALTQRPPKR
jgi:Na+/H+ antiporter NhaC